jgi:hypothetical protein
MNANTIHHLTEEELKELLAKVASRRDKALTRRACDSLYCPPTPIGQRADSMFVKDRLGQRNNWNTILCSQLTSRSGMSRHGEF